MTRSLESYINNSGANQGNISVFTFPKTQALGQGQGILVRFGNGAATHYARVLVVNNGGQLLQGTYPNRFVEVVISYQATPSVPYAKGVPQKDSPIGGYSHRTTQW
jgi:hypothetical protein